MKRGPDFILIGAQKSGSTALYHALKQHPDIFMSRIKEPNFFLFEEDAVVDKELYSAPLITDWDSYTELFSKVEAGRAAGEASVLYLSAYHPERTARQIRNRLPQVKIIAILRHPADRAYSAYNFCRSRNLEKLNTFREAIAAEDQRFEENIQPALFYCRNGLYGDHLEKFLLCFPREQLKVFLYEEWNEHPVRMLKDIFNFLGVDPSVQVCPLRRAVTAFPRSLAFRSFTDSWSGKLNCRFPRMGPRLVHFLMRLNSAPPPPLERDLKNQLIEYFERDIRKLQKLIDRDLSAWLVRS